jgi:arylsulfatase A-like enzyme
MLPLHRSLMMGLAVACGLAVCVRSMAAEADQPSRPNIVVIMVDDMGYSDPGCYGGEIDTPNIDRLAAGGVRFTDFYNCSRCCPTRASLLTGAYAHRVGMREFGRTMDKNVPTLAENLRANGYATGMVGKWHLSELPQTRSESRRILWMNHEIKLDRPFAEVDSYPIRRGFEQFYGIIWGVVDHFDPFSLTDGERPVETVPDDYYMTDAISQKSVEYIRDFSAAEKPFFLYVAYTAPHWPIQAPEADIAKYRGRYDEGWDALRRERFARQTEMGLFDNEAPLGELSGSERPWEELLPHDRAYLAEKMAVHAAMVDRVDQGIGKILAQLREAGQWDNTVIFFLSDNGASPEIPGGPGYDRNSGTRDGRVALREADLRLEQNREKLGSDESYTGIGPTWASATNTPLRYWKAESYDGGCRTPLVVHWPAGIQAPVGGFVGDIGHVIDIAPTCYELASAEPEPTTLQDGISLAPIFRGTRLTTQRDLFFEHGKGAGIRRQQWKAVKLARSDWKLYNLETDPGETQNLARSNREQLAELVDAWNAWRAKADAENDGTQHDDAQDDDSENDEASATATKAAKQPDSIVNDNQE